ncbi:cytoplasm protein [Pseudozyma hubeiensis SY62]|uniref:Cytoplasm protein n=1 Tax=Pseudozyma hubeiensis (strain SY62) TaxID=1305764 RepID=R9P483_PSEHS|nr:cytoplasm protein [Pseudozyma hubeiensis SY62]GAC92880.1 cytoplasm protein [Pseudozyma hubeiensis SY62]
MASSRKSHTVSGQVKDMNATAVDKKIATSSATSFLVFGRSPCCANYLRFPFTLPLIRFYDPGAHVLAVRLEITYKDTPFPFAITPFPFSLLQPSPQVKPERMYSPSIVFYLSLDYWLVVCHTPRSACSTLKSYIGVRFDQDADMLSVFYVSSPDLIHGSFRR